VRGGADLEANDVAAPTAARLGKLARFILLRIVLGLLTLLLVSVVVFAATQALPGDAARAILGKSATPETLKVLREQLHLNRPVVSQYWGWLSGVLTGDLGTSLTTQAPVSKLLGDRVVNSAFLVGVASLIIFPVSIFIGALSAYKRDKLFDHAMALVTLGLAALPEFVIALTLVLLLSTTVFHLLPALAFIDPGVPVWLQLKKLVLPVLVLIIWEAPYVSRIMRASMIEILESDYVEMARLKGLPERRVVAWHALPAAIVPTIQVIAVQIAFLAGGLVIVEFIFGFPGIGQALVNAVADRDLPTVQAVSLLMAAVYVVLNLLADIATILVSPRLRTSFA
jgi:peptide/nickel transport system permease protein